MSKPQLKTRSLETSGRMLVGRSLRKAMIALMVKGSATPTPARFAVDVKDFVVSAGND